MWLLLVSQLSAPPSCAAPDPTPIPFWPYFLAKTLIGLYGFICLLSLVSLLRIICHHHKVYSFRFFFLLLSFTWTVLRIAFFLSSPSTSTPSTASPCTPQPDPSLSDSSPTSSSGYHLFVDMLYYLPASCQLAMFSLLVLFYARLYHQHVHDWKRVERRCVLLFASLNTAVMAITVTFVLVIQQPNHSDDAETSALLEAVHQGYFILSALFFLALTVIAAYYFHRIYRHTPVSPSVASHLTLSSLIFALLLSRGIFDAGAALDSSAVLFRRQLYESRAGVLIELPTFVLLCVWEVLPTLLVILYFRDVPTVSSQSLTTSESGMVAGLGEWAAWLRGCCCGGASDDGGRRRTPFSSFHPAATSFYSEADAANRSGYGGLAQDEEAADETEAFYYEVDAQQLEETEEERTGRAEAEAEERLAEEQKYKALSVFSPYSASLLSLSSSPSHPFYSAQSGFGYQSGALSSSAGARSGAGSGIVDAQQEEDGRTRNGYDAH